MKRLKVILLCSAILLTILYIYIFVTYYKIEYINFNTFKGVVVDITKKDNKISFILKGDKKIMVYDYNEISDIKYGDYVLVKGKSSVLKNNSNFNLFNYKNYLRSKKIDFVFYLEEIEVLKKNDDFLYKIKNKVLNRLENINNSYLYTLIFAKNMIDDKIYDTYIINGVSHLFAISGMHISLFSFILFSLINLIIKNKKITSLFVSFFLFFYSFLVGYTISVLRCIFLYVISNILDIFNIKIKSIYILLIILEIFIIYNPFLIFDVGFKYSFTISIFLTYYSSKISSKNYFLNLIKVSLLSFLVSIPITVNQSFEVNILSFLLNLIFVPIITFVFFPFTLLSFIFPCLTVVLIKLSSFLEFISLFFSKYSLNINISYMNIIMVVLYYVILICALNKSKNIVYFLIYFLLLLNFKYLDNSFILTIFDVGQGDSMLITFPFNDTNILLDTGGNYHSNLSKKVLIPSFKSRKIKKIDYLILSHGDYDHMGEAINLVENFKVEKVIFNCGEFNELEQGLIKVLDKKKIPYYSCIQELNINDNKLYFLNNKDYDNENDNSSVIYTKLNNHKFLFMGDAGVEVEQDLIEKYNLQDIDVLKVGHHGSNTSSSKEFIDETNPKYSIISVGKNNRYGHPNKEALENLSNSKIYRTDIDGSIMFKIKNNKLKIETCSP